MDIQFYNTDHVPKPRGETKLESLALEPYRDGRRVRVVMTMTPFSERPNLVISAFNEAGQLIGEADVLEVMTRQASLTLHLRGPQPQGTVTIKAQLYYDEDPPQSELSDSFEVAPPAG